MTIAKSAIIPALLYYLGSFVAIHYVSKKFGVLGRKEKILFTFAELIIIIAPLAVFIVMLLMSYTVIKAAFVATIVSFLVTVATYFAACKSRPKEAMKQTGKLCFDTAVSAADTITKIAGLLVGAQIVITMISYTGFGLKLSSLIVQLGQNNLLLCLIMTMIVCIILGMGMPIASGGTITLDDCG